MKKMTDQMKNLFGSNFDIRQMMKPEQIKEYKKMQKKTKADEKAAKKAKEAAKAGNFFCQIKIELSWSWMCLFQQFMIYSTYSCRAEEARRARVAAAKKEEEEIARVRAEALAKEKQAAEKRTAAAEDATIAATLAELWHLSLSYNRLVVKEKNPVFLLLAPSDQDIVYGDIYSFSHGNVRASLASAKAPSYDLQPPIKPFASVKNQTWGKTHVKIKAKIKYN
jgi:hypothetical protein